MKKQKTYDAILVLGINTSKKFFGPRVEKAASLFKKGVAPRIIFSGRYWGGLKNKPQHSEARMMMQYALRLGVPRRTIHLEEKSLNTLGNFYFTRKLFLEKNNWKKILVITIPMHFKKSEFLAEKTLGSRYHLEFVSDGMTRRFIKSVEKGHTTLKQIQHNFKHIKNGDMRAIAKLMKSHPHYRRYTSL